MKFALSTLVLATIFLSGCDFFKKSGDADSSNNPNMDQKPAAVSSEPAAPASVCASGKEPQILNGDCTGTWSLGRREGKATCEFNWGPPVTCPEGTTAVGTPKVCYGTTIKQLTAKQETTDVAKCEEHFGNNPINPHYTLTCCPN